MDSWARWAEAERVKDHRDAEALFAAAAAIDADGADPATLQTAAILYERAVMAGSAEAANNLGTMYQRGRGVNPDPVRAVSLYRQAAEQGLASGCFNLGFMFAHGQGVTHDDGAAAEWFERAAARNDLDSLVWLGVFRALGRGGPADAAAARSLWERATAMGCERAPHNLGLMLSGGHGVEMDAREAWALFALAELRGNPQSHGRRIALEAAMTTTDLEHARQRLRALLPAPGTGGFTDDH